MSASFYKQFARIRIVFCLAFLPVCLSVSASFAAGANPAYTVEGVEVDVTAENAVKAREKALGEAQVKAYRMLAERLLSPEELQTFKAPDIDTISGLVQDFEVTNEQLSAVRYKGIYTVRFRPNAFKNRMAAEGKTYSDAPGQKTLILPFLQTGAATTLWGDANLWLKAWQALPPSQYDLQPVIVPTGDAQDTAEIANDQAMSYDPAQVQAMAERYQADDVAILIASTEPAKTAQGRITVNIYKNGFQGPAFVQKITVDPLAGETADMAFARAAMKVKTALRQNGHAGDVASGSVQTYPIAPPPTTVVETQTVGSVQPPIPYTRTALGTLTSYAVMAQFSSVQDWVRMKNILDRIYGMQAVVIKSLTPRQAMLDMRYAGNLQALQLSLQNAGIMMRAGYAGGPLEIYSAAGNQSVYR